MASTATNKQPLLIDRPLHKQVFLTTAKTGDAAVWLSANSCTVLVDCTQNDGAYLDDVYVISRSSTGYKVSLWLYNSTPTLRENDTANIGYLGEVTSSTTAGEVVHFDDLPYVNAPVPQVSVGSANTRAAGTQRGLYIPKGMALYVGRQDNAADVAIATAPVVGASGGFY